MFFFVGEITRDMLSYQRLIRRLKIGRLWSAYFGSLFDFHIPQLLQLSVPAIAARITSINP